MEEAICFLKGLNENFNNMKSNILMTNPLPDVAKIFSLVLQQERQLSTSISPKPAKILFNNTTPSSNNRKPEQKYVKVSGRPNFQGRGLSNFKTCFFCAKLVTSSTLSASYMDSLRDLNSRTELPSPTMWTIVKMT